jgi:hypothetical protein
MISLRRHPGLPVGVLLVILGLGNWVVSRSKLFEYGHRIASTETIDRVGTLSDYRELTPRTNATLLERLHRGTPDYNFTAAKLDFYTVVQSGGRLLAFIGLLVAGVALLRGWRERRVGEAGFGAATTPGSLRRRSH